MKKGWFLGAWVLVFLFALSFSLEKINFNITGNAIDGITAETDGCSLIDSTLKSNIITLGTDVTLKEGNRTNPNKYLVIPGHILKVITLSNLTGYESDVVNFSDYSSGQNYSTVIYAEGRGNLTIDSETYEVYYSDAVQLDFPQTTDSLMTFNCTPPCISNWTAVNTTCSSNETFTTWYNDTKSCGNLTGRPENKSYGCDYDKNGIVGRIDSIVKANINPDIYINGSLGNLSKNYTGSYAVEIKDNGTTRVQFTHNFSSSPMDFSKVVVKKQASSASKGYIIVNGIKESKTLIVDRKNNSQSVCIKDDEIDSISEISDDCYKSDEFPLDCPGSVDDFECNLTNTSFIVSGLTNSAVLEFNPAYFEVTNCSVSWNCSAWSSCVNGVQTKTCVDLNNCGVLTGKPLLTQNCSAATFNACVSNWSCGTWLPEDCPESGKQTRTCTDKKGCLPAKTEQQDCEYKATNWLFWGAIIVAGLCALGLLTWFGIYSYNKKKFDSASQPFVPGPPSMPPASSAPIQVQKPVQVQQAPVQAKTQAIPMPRPVQQPQLAPAQIPSRVQMPVPVQEPPKQLPPALQLETRAPRVN